MTIVEFTAIGTLTIAIVVLLLNLGRRSAKWEDPVSANGNPSLGELARMIVEHKRLIDLAGERSSVIESDTAQRFSRAESKIENLRVEIRKDYVLKDICDERVASKERTGDHSRHG